MLRNPIIRLTADNKPLSDTIMARIISLSITDNKTMQTDELTITLNDHDGKLALPKRGVKLQCWLGYTDTGTHNMGAFVVDSIEWTGTPDTITIKAKSADMKGSLTQGRSQSYHQKTLGNIAQQIATRHKLQLTIKTDLANINMGHIDQTDESDINLLTRICHHIGAVVSIKQNKLLIFKPNQNQSATGKPLNLTTITRQIGDNFRFNIEDRQSDVDNVSASYQDKNKAKKITVNTNKKGKKTKKLKGVYKDKASAKSAVHAEKQRLQAQQAKFTIQCAYAYPAISTESPIKLQGFKTEIDQLKWTVEKATHNYNKNQGLTTQLELVAQLK